MSGLLTSVKRMLSPSVLLGWRDNLLILRTLKMALRKNMPLIIVTGLMTVILNLISQVVTLSHSLEATIMIKTWYFKISVKKCLTMLSRATMRVYLRMARPVLVRVIQLWATVKIRVLFRELVKKSLEEYMSQRMIPIKLLNTRLLFP